MFAIASLVFSKLLLPDKKTKMFGISNRIFLAFVYSIFCVFVEVLLNAIGALTWDYSWWSTKIPFLIVIFGYLHFFLVAFWVFDMESVRKKLYATGVIYSVDIITIIVFGFIFGWL